jgi:hypothetical protein
VRLPRVTLFAMSWRLAGFVFGITSALLVFPSCMNDYDDFEFESSGGAAGAGASGGTGGIIAGGASGTGGISAGGASGIGGTPSGGASGTPGCPSGQKSCGGGCVDLADPDYGCATSGCDPCVMHNAQTQCVTNLCALLKCDTGFGDCNVDLGDGCESPLDDTTHCGACDRSCSTANSSSASCSAGKCAHACEPGFADCVQPASPEADDGCETDLAESATCGSCGNNCSTQGAGGGFGCKSGACGCGSNAQCSVAGDPNQAVCDTDSGLCSCNNVECKAGESCQKQGNNTLCRCNNTGAACAAGQTCCPGVNCKSLDTDVAHCGACGNVCPSGFVCAAGACACDGDPDCNAGSAGVCSSGLCECGGTTCAAGERCTAAGTCG